MYKKESQSGMSILSLFFFIQQKKVFKILAKDVQYIHNPDLKDLNFQVVLIDCWSTCKKI